MVVNLSPLNQIIYSLIKSKGMVGGLHDNSSKQQYKSIKGEMSFQNEANQEYTNSAGIGRKEQRKSPDMMRADNELVPPHCFG
jgi:hypothetical protein